MSLSKANIKKWFEMLRGNSILHVHQGVGQEYKKESIKGYYNNLKEKVNLMPEILDNDELPRVPMDNGELALFPTAIFQYGLGAYDLYLETGDTRYVNKFRQCCDWAIDKQKADGSWDVIEDPVAKASSMTQGEGASLLLRGAVQLSENYAEAAQKAIDFMLRPVEEGGTTLYENDMIVFKEFPKLPVVLNGWVFSWWGLYDYVIYSGDNGEYLKLLNKSCDSMAGLLPEFSKSYWSCYDLGKKTASPFYHELHIAQMTVMKELTGLSIFGDYAQKWSSYRNNKLFSSYAFVRKAIEKVFE